MAVGRSREPGMLKTGAGRRSKITLEPGAEKGVRRPEVGGRT